MILTEFAESYYTLITKFLEMVIPSSFEGTFKTMYNLEGEALKCNQ